MLRPPRAAPCRCRPSSFLTRLVFLSDTHARHHKIPVVPEGDILLHAGDLTNWGSLADVEHFNGWLGRLPHKHKVVIAGNHDFCFEKDPERAVALLTNAHYLQDQSLELEGLKLYGSPWQPRFCNLAFNLDRGPKLAAVWDKIPEGTDILLTHGPPHGQLDRTRDGLAVGCEDLARRLLTVRPRVHLFGHIHEGYGMVRGETTYVNASVCNVHNEPVNAVQILEL